MPVRVATSTVADGSMLKRGDCLDADALKNRQDFLETQGMGDGDAYTLLTSYDTDNFCRYYVLEKDTIPHIGGSPRNFLADAIVTTTPGTSIMLLIADCIGTVLYDERQNILMVSHLGRHSLEQQGARKSVGFLTEHFGTQPEDLKVWTTPAPGKAVYPIWALDNKGMKEVFFEQMDEPGVPRENITDNPSDSTKDLNYFSYSEFLKGNRTDDGDYAIVGRLD